MICRHFGVCGGCVYQDLPYEEQVAEKQKKVESVLGRIVSPSTTPSPPRGEGFFEILPFIPSAEQWFYRNKMEYVISENNGQVLIGLHERNRHYKVVNIEECLLQSSESNKIVSIVRNFAQNNKISVYDKYQAQGLLRYLIIRDGKNTDQMMVIIVTQNDNFLQIEELARELVSQVSSIVSITWSINPELGDTAQSKDRRVVYGNDYFEERIGQIKLQVSPYDFLQTNIYQTENLYKLIFEWLGDKNELLLDLYCGIGAISLFCASRVKNVIGIEIVPSAIENANKNAELNKINNCKFICGDVAQELDKIFPQLLNPNFSPMTVVLDPPRAGITKKVAHKIISFRPEQIIYVCCNIDRLESNLQSFLQFYKISKVQALDMFPHTVPMETVVLLERI